MECIKVFASILVALTIVYIILKFILYDNTTALARIELEKQGFWFNSRHNAWINEEKKIIILDKVLVSHRVLFTLPSPHWIIDTGRYMPKWEKEELINTILGRSKKKRKKNSKVVYMNKWRKS